MASSLKQQLPRILLAGLTLALLCAAFLRSPRVALADAPGQPLVMTAVPDNPTSVTVTWYNGADGAYGGTDCLADCETFLRFDLRYNTQGDDVDADYTYICSHHNDCNVSPQSPHVIYDDLGQPAYMDFGHYQVTGLSPDTSYCFEMRSVALETPVPPFGTAYTASSNWSAPRCAHTPAQLLIGPLPSIDLSGLAYYRAVITSPKSNSDPHAAVHDVLINVVHAAEPTDGSLGPIPVFDLQWSVLQSGSWQSPAPSPLDQLDKSSHATGQTLSNSLFTDLAAFPCGSAAAPCQYRNWRVRARVHGTPDTAWSDWVQFLVCSAPSGSC